MTHEAGAVTLPLLGIMMVAVVALILVSDLGFYVWAGTRASTAADAAALAAAPLTFRPFGSSASPRAEAARFSSANGANLVECLCTVDRSWRSRTVVVVTEIRIRLIVFGSRGVRATGRAEFVPTLLVR